MKFAIMYEANLHIYEFLGKISKITHKIVEKIYKNQDSL